MLGREKTDSPPKLDEWLVGEVLRRAAEFGPEREAIIFDGRMVTYGELDRAADQVAAGLAALGVRRGDRVAVLMANCPEYLMLYYGVARLGAVFVPVVTQSRAPELEYFLEHSDSVVLFADPERWQGILATDPSSGLRRVINRLRAVVIIGDDEAEGAIPFDALLANAVWTGDFEPPTEDDVYAYMYTSGTTGRPKAVMHSHFTGVAQAAAVSERLGYTHEDRLMTIFPLFHGNALVWSALTAAYASTPLILTERFSATRFWDQVREHRVTAVNLLIGAVNMLLAQPPRDDDLEHGLKVTPATVTESIHRRFTERFGVEMVTLWALAEAPLGTMVNRGYGYEPGLIGWPMGDDNEVRVVDADGDTRPNGEIGELIVRNRAIMAGYHKNPEETARVIRDGWVRSGDLGWQDDQGRFYFVGRHKHVIRRAGENVSGEEVEDCIADHPAVAECAALAVPDEIRGEEVKICVVARAGSSVAEEELILWAQERLSDFKVPRYIEFRNDLPRTGPEKVAREQLQAEPGIADCWDRTLHFHGR